MADKTAPRVLGATGLRYTAGRVQEDELARDLKFPLSLITYNKMESDPIIAGTLFMIKQFMRKVQWDVEPKGGLEASDYAKEKADIIRDNLFNGMERSFDQLMSDICSFIKNGFGFHEPTFKVVDGNILWKDFPARPPSSIKGFVFDKQGYVTHVEQYQVNTTFNDSNSLYLGTTKKIPYDRLLHFRTDSEKNNPLGRSILKNAYRSWYIKSKLEEHEAIGVEREMNGIPFIRAPSEITSATKDSDHYDSYLQVLTTLQNMRNNEQAGLMLPSDRDENGNLYFDFQLIQNSGGRSLDTSKIIERWDYRVAQSLLNDFLLMGSSSTGSFALSDNKVNTFVQSLEAYLEVISEQFNRRAIKDLYNRNGWDLNEICKLVHKPISSPTISEIADFLQKADGYITPDKTFENFARREIGAPDRDEEELYLDKPTAAHQSTSQRIAMENAASKNDNSSSDLEELEKSLNESLKGNYNGEA